MHTVKPRQNTRRRQPPVTRPRAGISLVELIVAILVLTIGLLGLAALSIKVNAQQRHAGKQQLAAMVVQSRFDSLSSIHCQALVNQTGTTVTRGITERWRIADGNDIKVITDTVIFAPRLRPIAYLSVIPCRD